MKRIVFTGGRRLAAASPKCPHGKKLSLKF